MKRVLDMRKYYRDTQSNVGPLCLNIKPISAPTKDLSDDSDNYSLTDVSSIVETKSSLINCDQTPKFNHASIESKSTTQIDSSTYDQNVLDDQLSQSLFDYANSFNLDQSVYSIVDLKNQLDSTNLIKKPSAKQRTQLSANCIIPSLVENTQWKKQKSYDHFKYDSQLKRSIQQDLTKLIPSNFFSMKTNKDSGGDDDDNQYSDENTTIPDGSKFEWEYLSDAIDHSNKSSKISLQNSPITTNSNHMNSNYLKDFQELPSANFTKTFSTSPIIICEKTKQFNIDKHKQDQLLHEYTSLIRPAHIIVREIFYKSSPVNPSILADNLPSFLTASSKPCSVPKPCIHSKHKLIYEPISLARNKLHTADDQSQKIIIEYDHVNVNVDKTVRQRKEIKRVNPNQYIQHYGNSLYTNEVFRNLLTKIIA
ncbi:unnamed protein product [Rotaria socialis]